MISGLFKHSRVRAFSLLELSVSLAVMVTLMGILLARYPETAIRLTLSNIAHKTSLIIREAQVRGSAVDSRNSTLGTDSPIAGYGLYAELSEPNKIVLFNDTVDSNVSKPYGLSIGDGLYQSGSPVDETSSITTLPNGYSVAKLCVLVASSYVCNSNYSPNISTLTVSFIRPNPQPYIYINGSSSPNFSSGCIELHSPRAPQAGHIQSILVFNSGMIRTQTSKCD